MADNVVVTAGTGTTMAADEVTDGTLGSVKVGFGKIMDGTLDSTNKLIVTAAGAAKVDGSAVTQPVSGTFWQATQPVSASSLPLPTGAATSANQSTGNTSLASIATNTSSAIVAGTNIIGKVGIDQTTPGTTNFVAANLTQINGSAISSTNPLPTTQVAPTGNGFTPYKLINAATTNATNVKASAGDVGGIQVYNNSGVIAYFKLYDKASAPTVGTDTPVKTIIVPANTSGAGTNVSFASPGISFASGISFALTTGITDADTGAIASANTISINIDYK